MSADYIGWGIGIAGFLVAVYGICDARRERNRREKSVVIVNRLVGRLNGLLIGLKPATDDRPAVVKAIDDGLSAIEEASDGLDAI